MVNAQWLTELNSNGEGEVNMGFCVSPTYLYGRKMPDIQTPVINLAWDSLASWRIKKDVTSSMSDILFPIIMLNLIFMHRCVPFEKNKSAWLIC